MEDDGGGLEEGEEETKHGRAGGQRRMRSTRARSDRVMALKCANEQAPCCLGWAVQLLAVAGRLDGAGSCLSRLAQVCQSSYPPASAPLAGTPGTAAARLAS